jgi:hypothetical protein
LDQKSLSPELIRSVSPWVVIPLFLVGIVFSEFLIVHAATVTTDTSTAFSTGSFDNVIDNGSGSSPDLQLTQVSENIFHSSGSYTSRIFDLGSRVIALGAINWAASGVQNADPETPANNSGLLAQWNFDETNGSTAASGGSCGSSCNGTLHNFADLSAQDQVTQSGWTSTNKKWGAGSLMLDGTNDYFQAVTNGMIASQFTISFWFSSQAPPEGWFMNYTNDNAYYGWSFLFDSGIFHYVANTSIGGTRYAVLSLTPITDSNWHYITVTDDGATAKLYIDGKLDNSGEANGIDWAGTMYFSLGAGRPQKPQAFGWTRVNLDNISVYDRIQSADEVLANYQAGNITFQTRSSPDGNTWESWADVSNGNISSTVQRYFQYRADFTTSDSAFTPALTDVTFDYTNTPDFVLKDLMTRGQVNMASDHALSFGTDHGLTASGDTLTLTFPDFDLSHLTIGDIDLSDDLGQKILAATPEDSIWGVVINDSTKTITFTAPTTGTGYIPAISDIYVNIGTNAVSGGTGTNQIVNPATAGTRTISYSIINTSGTETGQIAVSIVDSDQVDILGSVATLLNFDIDTGTSDSIDCSSTTCQSYEGGAAAGNYTVDLGELSSTYISKSQDSSVTHSDGNSGRINSVYLDLGTNASGGARVYLLSANGALAGPAPDIIPAVTDGQNITANSNTYGYNLASVGTPAFGSINFIVDCTSPDTFCGPKTVFTEILDTNNQQLESGRIRIDLAAATSYTNKPGSYTDTLTFIAVANF